MPARRSPGTGSLYVRSDTAGNEKWYAHWRDEDGRQIKRVVGPKRMRGTRDGLTKIQAEAELRRLIDTEQAAPRRRDHPVTFAEVAERFVERKRANLKTSTLEAYESTIKIHLLPSFGDRDVARITGDDVEAFIASTLASGSAEKSVRNYLGVLHSIFELAVRKDLAPSNPCEKVEEKPRVESSGDIHFLDEVEVEALLRAEADDPLGRVLRATYLTAAMTGLRQGELLGLRWSDVDWGASRIRVRRAYVRGEFGTPKSKRSSRSVPLADRVAGELDRLFQASAFQDDDDLVFAHPKLGHPLDRSKVRKRYVKARDRAGIRKISFHDLRHTFATQMAGAGVPMRTLQEWLGHRDIKTTMIYADYAPSEHEASWVNQAFGDSQGASAEQQETRGRVEP